MTTTTTVTAGTLREGDLLYVAGDLITVGRVKRLRATRTNPARVAVYALRVDSQHAVVDPARAACWPVTKTVRLDPTSPRYATTEK